MDKIGLNNERSFKDLIEPKDEWGKLSMREKAAMIEVGVRNGMTSMNDIRSAYNEFAEGGNIYSGDEEETQQMEVSRSPHIDLAISNPWLYQKLHPASRKEEVYEPSTFAGRIAQLAGIDELGQKYTDYTSSTIQQFPVVGTAISAADLGYDLNRLYHNPSLTTTKDVTLDAASLVPALRKTMKGWWMKGNSGSFITETGQIINNPRVASTLEVALQPFRTAINTGVYGARAADFLDDSKAYLKEMYNSSKIGKHFPIKSLGGPLVEAAMNEYKSGGGIHIKPSHRGRLTELKKRTGKTEAELYRTGGPAVRKMITFARNARKWKHGDGGLLVKNILYPQNENLYGFGDLINSLGQKIVDVGKSVGLIETAPKPKVYVSKPTGRRFNTEEEAKKDAYAYNKARALTDKTNAIPVKYIGSNNKNPSEQRKETWNQFWQQEPVLNHAVDSIASAYNLDPEALRYRLNTEGFTEDMIHQRNDSVKNNKPVDRGYALLNQKVADNEYAWYSNNDKTWKVFPGDNAGFMMFGLDDVADYINEGQAVPINESWYDSYNKNEKGRMVHSATGETIADNIGLMGATLRMFTDQAKEDYPNVPENELSRYGLAYYNRGRGSGKTWVKNGAKGYNYK